MGALLQCESGVWVSGLWCYTAGIDEDELLILGEKGCIKTGGLALGPVHLFTEHNGGFKEAVFEFPQEEHVAGPFVQTLVDEMTGGKKSNADAKSAANNVRVVDAILAAYRKRASAIPP
jgi:hypothetical protein